MQPGRLGAAALCVVACALLGTFITAPSSRAQVAPVNPVAPVNAGLQTPQEANDRIRQLASNAHGQLHDYVIGSGDVLEIDVFDVKELSREVRVSQTGSIGIPLIPVRVHVAGLTEVQAEQKIAELLEANGLVSHPDVSISVKERKSKPITVVGAVSHPMVYQADRPVSVLEVLAEAGGIANDAGDTVIVVRPAQDTTDSAEPPAIGPEQPTTQDQGSASAQANSSTSSSPKPLAQSSLGAANSGSASPNTSAQAAGEPPPLSNTITINLNDLMEIGDAKNNMLLQAGDIVTVPHAGIVYVLGAVNKAGGFVLSNDRTQLTALKILSLAGGLTRTAKSDKAVIVRKDSQGQQHEVALDLKKLLNRQAEDLQLQPSDILYVPDSGAKQALYRSLEFGIALGSGVALYRLAYH